MRLTLEAKFGDNPSFGTRKCALNLIFKLSFKVSHHLPKKLKSTTTVNPQYLQVKYTEQIGSSNKNYCITINMQKSFTQSAQLIKKFWF